jgi:hypothetical protein
MLIKWLDEVHVISREVAEKNWERWGKMRSEKMGIIKELDEWLNDSESREKEINIDETTIIFIKSAELDRINISVIRDTEEVSNFYLYMSIKTTSAISLLRCSMQVMSYNVQVMNIAIYDIRNCIGGEE